MARYINDERIETVVDGKNDVVVGAALVAASTDGFLYIPHVAGTPTGTPTTRTGFVAMCFDSTNNKLYVYDGGWLASGALS